MNDTTGETPVNQDTLFLDQEACAAFGRANRDTLSRKDLSVWKTHKLTRDPIGWLLAQERYRIGEFVPLRHHRMAQSPLSFYRGSAIIMANDLAGERPRTDLIVQLCGDAHLANFGLFAAPNRSVVFDINDFDETYKGPFEWDVYRLVTSFELACRELEFSTSITSKITLRVGQSYREKMHQLSQLNEIDIWYECADERALETEVNALRGQKGVQRLKGHLEKEHSREHRSAIEKLTEVVDGQRQFVHNPPLLIRVSSDGHIYDSTHRQYEEYQETLAGSSREVLQRYRVVDVAHKIVGVGSVGMAAYVYLLQGRHIDDVLLFQTKEATESVLAPFVPYEGPAHQGQRVIVGQRLIQAASDLFLGWVTGVPDSKGVSRHFYVRQLRDMKWAPDLATLDAKALFTIAHLEGQALARAHARSGNSIAISGYLGKSTRFERSMQAFGNLYAGQVEGDYEAFMNKIDEGEIEALDENGIDTPDLTLRKGKKHKLKLRARGKTF